MCILIVFWSREALLSGSEQLALVRSLLQSRRVLDGGGGVGGASVGSSALRTGAVSDLRLHR